MPFYPEVQPFGSHFAYVELKELNHTKPAVGNKILIEKLPKEFQNICRLKIALESKSILFKKMFTPKGQSPQIKGSLCNVPILEVPKKSLREPAASNVLATVKQKAKKKKKKSITKDFSKHFFVSDYQPKYSILN